MADSPYIFSAEQKVINNVNGVGVITLAGILGAFEAPARSSGRYAIRFECDGADLTLGDGSYANAVAIVAQRDGSGAVSQVEVIGYAGMNMGNGVGAPQVPMKNKSGANPRSFTQIVELTDGFAKLGLAGMVAAQGVGGGASLTVYVSAILS
jgi:hypothetical protein